ncbi:hypothetical protein GCM10027194_35030 [Thalassiella azotivora]
MPISVKVWTLPDSDLARCLHPDLNRLVEFAKSLNLPMLGNVDPCDDTRFNSMQLRLVVHELRTLVDSAPEGAADAARALLALTELVDERPHRYLVFLGD